MKPQIYRKDIVTHAPEFEGNDIFKYGPLAYLEQTLTNCTLKFSKLDRYNDPFETKFQYRHRFKDIGSRNSFLRQHGLTETKADLIKNYALQYFECFVATCFSLTPYEPLMWSHYADDHKGVCYCFDKTVIFSGCSAGEVCYSSRLPTLDYFEGSSSMEHLKPQLEDIILTKSNHWSYEREFRFYKASDSTTQVFNPTALEAVVLGSRVEKKDAERVISLVLEFNATHQTDVKVFYTHASRNSYSMTIGYNSLSQSGSITCPIYNVMEPNI